MPIIAPVRRSTGSQSAVPPATVPANGDLSLHGLLEPPEGLLIDALRRNWLLVLICAVVLGAAGVGIGTQRASTYTAAATLQVGQVNPNSPGFYSYVSSAAALATAFSRGIDAEPVLTTVQHELGLSPARASARLSSEPLPLSPAFRVFATGPTASAAIRLANVTATALIAYEGQANSSNPQAETLLGEYRTAAIAVRAAASNVQDIERRHGRGRHTEHALATARAEYDTATVRLSAIGAAYTAAVTSQAPRRGLVSLIAGATSASSDHSAKMQLTGLLGLIAGLALGCLLAVLRTQRLRRAAREVEATMRAAEPA